MPRARAGMSSPGAMSDAIVRVNLADMVWLPLDGRKASAWTRVFLVEIGTLCFIKAMVPIVVMADVYPSGLIGGPYSAATLDCTVTFLSVRCTQKITGLALTYTAGHRGPVNLSKSL
jgi:hypothetical protein